MISETTSAFETDSDGAFSSASETKIPAPEMNTSTSNEDQSMPSNVAVGLSNREYADRRRRMIDLTNRLHNTGAQLDIDLPVIAVIGSQSAGKSSLIEAISGISLPRASGTCTRCPTECRLSYSEEPWKCVVTLRFITDAEGNTLGQPRNIVFGDPIADKIDVTERIRRAQRAILNPNANPLSYLTGPDEDVGDRQVAFSHNCISLQISGKDVADLSFVDLPGLIASVSRGGAEEDIALIQNLATSYIQRSRCIILLTVACETDFENQGAHLLAERYDPEGKRTIGVLTKPDRIESGDEDKWLKYIRAEDGETIDWYSVKNPNPQAVVEGITWEEARQSEKNFFNNTIPWSNLDELHRKRLGTERLTQRLSDTLSNLIAARLPQIQEELEKLLAKTEEDIGRLPKPPSNEPLSEILRLIGAFVRDVEKHTEGTPSEAGLLQQLRPFQEEFKRSIRRTAPAFCPFERQNARPSVPVPSFLTNEDDAESLQLSGSREIYIDEVMEHARTAVTRELPNHVPFVVQRKFITAFISQWATPSRILFTATQKTLMTQVMAIVEDHFGAYTYGGLKQHIANIVSQHIRDCANETLRSIDFLLKVEATPYTRNTHYLDDYRTKFLDYYKGIRQSTENNNLIAKLSTENAPPADGTERSTFDEALQKVLSGLSELGIHGVQPLALARILPPALMEDAISIMADVRAYFQVAYKRFVDNVPMAIDEALVRGITNDLETVLFNGLHVNGPNGYATCKRLLQEPVDTSERRSEYQKRRERLHLARQELLEVFS